MSVRIRSRRYYECDTEAERDLSWGPDALIYCIDTDTYYKIYAGDYVEVPLDEVFFVSPIDINKIAISGVPDGLKFLRDDGSWAEPAGTGGSSSGGLLVAEYKFSTTTTMADPSNGYLRLNNATYASVTQIAFSVLNNSGTDFTRILAALSSGDVLYLQDKDDATRAVRFKVSGTGTNNTTWFQIPVTHVTSVGTLFGNNNVLAVAFGFVTLDGSGHVIWDNADTPMAQEPVLQFKRLNVTAETGKTVVTRPADTFTGTTPPSSPVVGDIWKNTETWKTYTWFDSFWVEDMSNAQGGSANVPPNAVFDGMGATVLVNSQSVFRAASSGVIKGWSIIAKGTNPTCTLDIWKIAAGTALPTVANTIMGTKPALATGNAIYSTSMPGWTLSYNAGDIFIINVDACANATYIQLLLYI